MDRVILTYNNEYNDDAMFINISATPSGDAGTENQVMMPNLSNDNPRRYHC